jgi:DNA-binding response OmpR family regulator
MRPDIVLLTANWPQRALLRAQLVEEGYEVIATDNWATARTYVEALVKPRLVIVDLQDIPEVDVMLDELHAHMRPERVLVLTALWTKSTAEMQARGFHALGRPAAVRDVVRTVAALLNAGHGG